MARTQVGDRPVEAVRKTLASRAAARRRAPKHEDVSFDSPVLEVLRQARAAFDDVRDELVGDIQRRIGILDRDRHEDENDPARAEITPPSLDEAPTMAKLTHVRGGRRPLG